MDYNKLELLSKSFINELTLCKNNLIKARKSKAFKDFDGFMVPNELTIKNTIYPLIKEYFKTITK